MNQRPFELRLNRFLARAGYGSRRAVESLIRDGQVMVNGVVVRDLGVRVDPQVDRVTVAGAVAVVSERFAVYAFHKPLGVVCTFKGQGGQPTLLPYRRQAELPERFNPVGRLDSDTTGLLLWTDDGDLNQRLCRPSSAVWKTYEVRLAVPLAAGALPTLCEGRLELDGRPCRPCRLEAGGPGDPTLWRMQLHEGRKRQIRRMFEAVGARVVGLHRTAYGPVQLGGLRSGGFRQLTNQEVEALHRAAAGGQRL